MTRADNDDLFREAQLTRDRFDLGDADEPTTRESQYVVSEEFRRLARELRSSWAPLTQPARRRNHA